MSSSNESNSNVVDLLAAMRSRGFEPAYAPKQVPSQRHAPRAEPATFRIRIELQDTPVWRSVDIRSDLTLDAVHGVVQVSMGWTDSHLHLFAKGPSTRHPSTERYLMDFSIDEGEEAGIPESEVRLDEVLRKKRDRLFYEYDFGDGWDHILTLTDVLPVPDGGPLAVCIDGSHACPPEDCGGIPGYHELLQAVANPSDPDSIERLDWVADWQPETFDIAAVNDSLASWNGESQTLADPGDGFAEPLATLLRSILSPWAEEVHALAEAADLQNQQPVDPAVAAEMVRPYQWLLDWVGVEGLPLTAAGYLKPDDVLATAVANGWDQGWIGKYNREAQTFPVLDFRESAQKLGLTRKFRGRLVQTVNGKKLSHNPEALWRYLATKVPFGDDCERDAGILVLLMTANGQEPQREALREWLVALGWRHTHHEEISDRGAYHAARPTLALLGRIGALPDFFAASPLARQRDGGILFARAALST